MFMCAQVAWPLTCPTGSSAYRGSKYDKLGKYAEGQYQQQCQQ